MPKNLFLSKFCLGTPFIFHIPMTDDVISDYVAGDHVIVKFAEKNQICGLDLEK